MIEAELFDGTVLEFPDGTDQAVIQRVVKEQTTKKRGGASAPETTPAEAAPAVQETPAEQAEEPSMLQQALGFGAGVLDQGMRGTAEGVINVLGLPQAIMAGKNAAVSSALQGIGLDPETAAAIGNLDPSPHLLPSAEGMKGAGDAINNFIADTLGLERPRTEPANVAERFANRTGQEIGAMALPTAGIVSKAQRIGPEAARQGGALSRMFLEPAAVNPARFVRNETTMATGAGLGASVANEMVDPNTTAGQVADVLGAISGAGATAVGGTAMRSVGELLGAIFNRPGYVDDVVRESVVDRLAEAGGVQTAVGEAPDTAGLARQIDEGSRVSDVVPGVQESLADRTRNPGIASLEYSRQSGPNSGLFNTRRQENAQAIEGAIGSFEPQGSPAALREELDVERNRRLTDAGVQAANAEDAARRAIEPLTPQGTPAARGNTIRTALEDARETARARTEQAYESADVSGRQIAANDLIDAIDTSVSTLTQAEQSLLPSTLLDRIRSIGENPATLKEATDLRSELLRLQRAASADPRAERGGRNAARVLGKLAEDVDSFITRNVGPEERAALEDARAARFDEAERFGRAGDPVSSALARNEGGVPRMRDENVARSFTNSQNMQRLLAEADTPDVRRAIRDEMLSGLDATRADRIREFVDTNQEQIGRFPGLRDELIGAADARTQEADAIGQRADLERTLGTQDRRGTGTVGKFLSYSDAQSERAMREVLNARDPAAAADELLTFVGDDPQAVEGARKAFWQTLEKQSRRAGETTANVDGGQPWMPRAMKRFLDDPRNEAVAKRFYQDNPEHIDNLRRIVDALQGLDTRNSGKVPNTSGTAQSVLPSAETIGSRAFAYQRGQVGAGWLVTSLAAIAGRRAVRGARKDAIERMLDEALLDPDLASLLLKENNPANRAALARRAKVWFGNEANTIMNAMSADEEDDDTMRAINGR